MKKLILILAILSFTTGFSQTKKVCVKIAQFIPYCGGARPAPEMEAKLKIATPYANKKLIYVSENNKIDTITTDKNGCLKTKSSFLKSLKTLPNLLSFYSSYVLFKIIIIESI